MEVMIVWAYFSLSCSLLPIHDYYQALLCASKKHIVSLPTSEPSSDT